MRKIKARFFDAKIRTKMLISYILILSISVIAVCMLMYLYMTKIYKNQLLYSASQSFEQAQGFIGYRIKSAIYVSDLLRVNEDIQRIVSKEKEEVEGDILMQNIDMVSLENYIYSISNYVDIYQVSLYLPRYLVYSNQDVIFRNLNDFKKTSDYARLEHVNGTWLPPEKLYSANTNKTVEVISYLQKIYDVTQLNKMISVQRISIKSQDITDILEKSNVTAAGSVWIENSRGELISCYNQALYEQMKPGMQRLKEAARIPEEWGIENIDGQEYYIRGASLAQTDWKLVVAMPRTEVLQANTTMLRLLGMVLIMLIVVGAIVSVVFSKMITSRISRLAASMESVKDAVPHLEEEISEGNDEIGQLYQSFRDMSTQLEELMEREYENGKEVKHAELRALQAQINPHFLYNTLDLINWEALDCGADRITKISRALAKFYKLSLNKGKEFSKVREELEHVRYYIMIQNFRYDNRLVLTEEVPEEMMDYEILHLVLQPLVENAFVHGMAGRGEEDILQLCIRGYEEEDNLVLEVSDNGCGMTSEQMDTILDEEKGTGYGVRNIHKRFGLVYGEIYGLKYSTSAWGGVCVRLTFPKERGDMA